MLYRLLGSRLTHYLISINSAIFTAHTHTFAFQCLPKLITLEFIFIILKNKTKKKQLNGIRFGWKKKKKRKIQTKVKILYVWKYIAVRIYYRLSRIYRTYKMKCLRGSKKKKFHTYKYIYTSEGRRVVDTIEKSKVLKAFFWEWKVAGVMWCNCCASSRREGRW